MILLVYKRVYDGMMEAFLMLSQQTVGASVVLWLNRRITGNWIVKMNLCSIHSIGLSNSRKLIYDFCVENGFPSLAAAAPRSPVALKLAVHAAVSPAQPDRPGNPITFNSH